jgi:N-acetylmuramoyl-L-alanine amidase
MSTLFRSAAMNRRATPYRQPSRSLKAGGCRRHVAGLLLSLCAVLVFLLAATTPLKADEDTSDSVLEKRYDIARAYYHNLQYHHYLGKTRSRWEHTVRDFRQIYLARPKDDLGMKSLFMMGRLYYDLYARFHQPLDLDEAISYYDDITLLFPRSPLADDALYILGQIYLNDKNNPQRANESFLQITCNYPESDMAPNAAEQLNALKGSDPPLPKPPANSKLAQVEPVKFWSTSDYTRVVVQTSAPVTFSKHLLEKQDDRPRRLFLDFAASQVPTRACRPIPIQDGLLKRVRVGQFSRDTVRVVLDIESISSYKIFTLQDPFRAVIDVKGWEQKEATPPPEEPVVILEANKKTPPDTPATKEAGVSGPVPSLAQQLGLGINKIVIDPGHGGKDPGAIAPNGLKEKDIVLAVSKKLARMLREKLGCEVMLTRTTDVFIPLEERTAIANTEKGDLFISVHVNSAPSPRLLGVETYVLNLTNDEGSMRLAALENATSTSKMSDLQNILADLLNNNKLDESTKLADHVQTSMAQGMQLKDLGVKQAPFYVLIGAQMPAILCEITFLSNPNEARRLREDNYLQAIAEHISTGVDEYIRGSNLAMVSP